MKSITEQDFREAFSKAMRKFQSSPSYYEPKEIYPGLWQIGPMWVGDDGKKMFDESIRKEARKLAGLK